MQSWRILCVSVLALVLSPALTAMAEDSALSCNERISKTAVENAASGLSALLQGIEDSDERAELVRRFIKPIRFFEDDSGYFYVYDFSCVNIAHACQPDLHGRDLSGHQDAKGKYVIRELSAAARAGGGFVEFHWRKPGDEGEHRKLGYVAPIPGTSWFIGSGTYLGDN